MPGLANLPKSLSDLVIGYANVMIKPPELLKLAAIGPASLVPLGLEKRNMSDLTY
jgi:hypothetical protein